MRIAFVDVLPWDYCIDTAYTLPLGGAQSALCYLAEALALSGHEVRLLNQVSASRACRGVQCFSLRQSFPPEWLQSLDAVVLLDAAGLGSEIRTRLPPETVLVLWTGHASDQPAMEHLGTPTQQRAFDGIALVSEWQRMQYLQAFGLDARLTKVLPNGIAPPFAGLFSAGTSILAEKHQPPILAYTSTPYRGLHVLLKAFPAIRSAVPGTRLKVFSSMRVYQVSESRDQAEFGGLYDLCRAADGVDYRGSVPQPELARELREVAVLAYPNTYPETSCIAALEAMACGCAIITSDRGALSETTAGFARLIPINLTQEEYLNRFVEQTLLVLREVTGEQREEVEAQRQRQIAHVNRTSTWSYLADQWSRWLGALCLARG